MKTHEIITTRHITTPDGTELVQHIWSDSRLDFRDLCGNRISEPVEWEYKNATA